MRRHHLYMFLVALVLGGAVVFLRSRPAGMHDGAPPDDAGLPPEAAMPMVQRLAAIVAETDPMQNAFLNDRRVGTMRARLAAADDASETITLQIAYARELLFAGRSVEAVREWERLDRLAEQHPDWFAPGFRYLLHEELAVAYLRVGEQDNCLNLHNAEACLLPIRGGGVHTVQRGSRAADRLLRAQLEANGTDLGARWLLNVVAMTLGEYPESIPEAWRIPPEAFASETPFPRWRDFAPELAVAQLGLSGGSAMEDFNGDGLLDVIASSWYPAHQLKYFENTGAGTFTDRTDTAGLTGLLGGLNLCHADYDNDGDADVFVLRGAWFGEDGRHPNSLLRNNGDGTFTDVTQEAGLLTLHPTQTATWGDYDNDGFVDLYIGNETGDRTSFFTGRPPDEVPGGRGADPAHACELFHNNGDGTFTNVAAAAGVAHVGFVKGVAWGDYDNDGDLDLHVSVLGERNVLYRNDGPVNGTWRFTDVGAAAGVDGPVNTLATWFFDYDNDGWLDLFAGGYATSGVYDIAALYLGEPHSAERSRIFHNEGDGTFTDVSAETGADRAILVMGANYGDLDNDGWLDWYAGNGAPSFAMLLPNRMFRNDGRGRFQDVTTAGGFGHVQKGHAIAFGDYDNDGDQDFYMVVGGAYSGDVYPNAFFVNPGSANHWITLRLEGRQTNRPGMGARIAIHVDTPAGPRTMHRVAGTGGSFGSSSLQQEIGLGDATGITSLDIFWPGSGTTQTFTGIDMDQCILVREGDASVTTVALPSVASPASRPAAHQHDDVATADAHG